MAMRMEDQLTVRLPKDLSRALEAAARRMHRRSGEVVRMALRRYLEQEDGTDKPADRVRDLIGSVDSGVPDLAERHRDYVLDSIRRGR